MSYHSAATPRIVGTATTAQTLAHLFNADTTKVVSIYAGVFQMDATAALTSVMPLIKAFRTTGAAGGTAATKVNWDNSSASDTDVVFLGAATTDGSAASAITVSTGATLWQQYGMRLHTAVGQVLGPDFSIVPLVCGTYPIVLRQNQGVAFQVVAAAAASNPATNHYFIQLAWSES